MLVLTLLVEASNKLVHCMLACFYFSLKVNFKLKQLKIVLKLIPIRNHTKTDEPTNENAVPAFELWPALIVCLLAAD